MSKYPEVDEIMNLINDATHRNLIQQKLEELVEKNYREGFSRGSSDTRSRDYASHHGHDMGQ